MHPAQLPIEELLKQCDIKRTRASGPGGQKRNKTETAIVITHRPSGLIGQASEARSQEENRKRATRRLRIKLAIEHREPVGLFKYRPPDFLAARIVRGRLELNPRHRDFPSVLAEVLDLIEAERGDVAKVAIRLDLTTSQIIKLLKAEPAALERVNAMRKSRRDRPLK